MPIPLEVLGDQFVTGLTYTDKDSGETKKIDASGIFVEAGVSPQHRLCPRVLLSLTR
jgi:alkyl hydroperoxide reductase subunit AhpF